MDEVDGEKDGSKLDEEKVKELVVGEKGDGEAAKEVGEGRETWSPAASPMLDGASDSESLEEREDLAEEQRHVLIEEVLAKVVCVRVLVSGRGALSVSYFSEQVDDMSGLWCCMLVNVCVLSMLN